MARELFKAGIEVDFQFTGRAFDKYFDMAVFNGHQLRHGLTFSFNKGQVSYMKTLLTSKPITFIKEIKNLELKGYDLVISDFEPVTAWAAKLQGVSVVGIGHQYAFNHNIPREGADPIAEMVMKYYAPVNIGLGLHWHHFGQPVLPPIIETREESKAVIENKIIVYLPFEDIKIVIGLLSPFNQFEFHIYTVEDVQSPFGHIICKPLSREGFQEDLIDCAGIISNAGFELASEALQMGKKILVKPLHSQMEQISNAAALHQLGYGHVMNDLDGAAIEQWLHHAYGVLITYPNTAKIVVEWLLNGMPEMTTDYVEAIWSTVDVKHLHD
jgi:uncharacterized protein (TIGR00661 family)